MKILITGSNGFVGKNLIAELRNQGFSDLLLCDRSTTKEELENYAKSAEIVYHLAGVNRPKNEIEFDIGNREFTDELLTFLEQSEVPPPVIFASSTQAELANSYGKSKKDAETLILSYGRKYKTKVEIYQFPNLFGKWSKPNYNSVIATFCHNISREIPVQISNKETKLTFAYIDDVIKSLINHLFINEKSNESSNYNVIQPTYEISLGELVELIMSFKESRNSLSIPQLDSQLVKKLYSTYLSYLPENSFSYELKTHEDNRGSFTEVLRTPERGQVSINISKPGIVKGNHWHHTKNEKFLVVSGRGVIRFRKIDSGNVVEYFVSSEKLEVVDIPVGYTHNIENLGQCDMVTLMWANEAFDSSNPDTYYMEV